MPTVLVGLCRYGGEGEDMEQDFPEVRLTDGMTRLGS